MAGAKFTPADGAPAPEPFAKAVKGRGARHRAGAALAVRLPKTICFVISQDGGVTVFWHDGSTPKTQRLKI